MTDQAELLCKELVEVVTDYLEGAMPAAERLRFERHLARCDGCAAYLEQMRQTIRLSGELREEHVPLEARKKLLRALGHWKREA